MQMKISLDKIVKRIYFLLAKKYEVALIEPNSYFYRRVISKIKNEPALIKTIKENIINNFTIDFDGESFDVVYREDEGKEENLIVNDDLAKVFEMEYQDVLRIEGDIKKYNYGKCKRYLDDVDLDILFELCDNNEQLKLLQILLDMYYALISNGSYKGKEALKHVLKDIIMIDGDEELLNVSDKAYEYIDRIVQLKFKDEGDFIEVKFTDVKSIYSKIKEELEI